MKKKKNEELKVLEGNFKEVSEIEKCVRHFLRESEYWVKYQEGVAKIMRARYLELIKEGFTEEQAIKLCRTNNILG